MCQISSMNASFSLVFMGIWMAHQWRSCYISQEPLSLSFSGSFPTTQPLEKPCIPTRLCVKASVPCWFNPSLDFQPDWFHAELPQTVLTRPKGPILPPSITEAVNVSPKFMFPYIRCPIGKAASQLESKIRLDSKWWEPRHLYKYADRSYVYPATTPCLNAWVVLNCLLSTKSHIYNFRHLIDTKGSQKVFLQPYGQILWSVHCLIKNGYICSSFSFQLALTPVLTNGTLPSKWKFILCVSEWLIQTKTSMTWLRCGMAMYLCPQDLLNGPYEICKSFSWDFSEMTTPAILSNSVVLMKINHFIYQ